MSFYYLASPYSHPDPIVRAHRYEVAKYVTGLLVGRHRIPVYSPIAHSHHFAIEQRLPEEHDFWLSYDRHIANRAYGLLVLCQEGWEESKGIAMEQEWFGENQTHYIRPDLGADLPWDDAIWGLQRRLALRF